MKKLIIIFFLLLSVSCKTIEYVDREVPIVQNHTEYVDKYTYDSIYVRDSIMLYINGDTVYEYKEKVKTNYIYKYDTICIVDSIPVPVRMVVTQKVNELYWWQKALILLGAAFIIISLIKLNKWKH